MEAFHALQAEALGDPLSVKKWLSLVQGAKYLAPQADSNGAMLSPFVESVRQFNCVNEIFERAIRHNGGSYKLWVQYIADRTDQCHRLHLTAEKTYEVLNALYERALAKLPSMPLLWSQYLQFLITSGEQCGHIRATKIRVTILAALDALPTTQHPQIWHIMKRWTSVRAQGPVKHVVPFATVKMLWNLYLAMTPSDPRPAAEYIEILAQRNECAELLCLTSELFQTFSRTHGCDDGNRSANGHEANRQPAKVPFFFHRPALWDQIIECLASTEVTVTAITSRSANASKSCEALKSEVDGLVSFGVSVCDQPERLLRSLALFFLRSGAVVDARRCLMRILEESSDPIQFQVTFNMLVAMEQNLVDAICISDLRSTFSSEGELVAAVENIWPAEGTPLLPSSPQVRPTSFLEKLIEDHNVLLNAVQLRQSAHSVRCWLKRVEAIVVRAHSQEGRRPFDSELLNELKVVFNQAFSLCRDARPPQSHRTTAESSDSDDDRNPPHTIAQSEPLSSVVLYRAYASILTLADAHDDCNAVLCRGAFHAKFRHTSHNIELFGVLAESVCKAHMDSPSAAGKHLLDLLDVEMRLVLHNATVATGGGRSDASRLLMCAGGGIDDGNSKVFTSPKFWNIALDVAEWAEGCPSGPMSSKLYEWMQRLGAYTTTIVLQRASRLHAAQQSAEAFRTLEGALHRCKTEGGEEVSLLAISESYGALYLRSAYGTSSTAVVNAVGSVSPKIERIREILDEGRSVVPKVFDDVPIRCIEFMTAYAAIEEQFGCFSSALGLLREVTLLAARSLATRSSAPEKSADLFDLEERYIRCLDTFGRKVRTLRGYPTLFAEMKLMLESFPLPPYCIAETALRYAAALQACREFHKTRLLFQLCSDKIDPTAAPVANESQQPTESARPKQRTPKDVRQQSFLLFWDRWERFESEFGDAASYRRMKEKQSVVELSFSKKEVHFEIS